MIANLYQDLSAGKQDQILILSQNLLLPRYQGILGENHCQLQTTNVSPQTTSAKTADKLPTPTSRALPYSFSCVLFDYRKVQLFLVKLVTFHQSFSPP
jgi:hypothetical protein